MASCHCDKGEKFFTYSKRFPLQTISLELLKAKHLAQADAAGAQDSSQKGKHFLFLRGKQLSLFPLAKTMANVISSFQAAAYNQQTEVTSIFSPMAAGVH